MGRAGFQAPRETAEAGGPPTLMILPLGQQSRLRQSRGTRCLVMLAVGAGQSLDGNVLTTAPSVLQTLGQVCVGFAF